MKMELKHLLLQNFKGCKELKIDFKHRTNIYGRNATGKTTIHDAVMWVLFNKMADGTKPDKIRPHDKTGKEIDFVDISATLDLEVDGVNYVIKKTQKQNWVKHHGEEKKVFEGNVNEWEVNGIPKTQMEFKKWMNQLVDEDVFMFTASASAFLKLPMKKRREQLFNLITEILNEDIIEKNPELVEIKGLLNNCTAEEAIKRAQKQITTYNKKLVEIPARIDEISKQRSNIDLADMELQKNELIRNIEQADKKREDILSAVDEVSKLSNELMKLQFEKVDIEKKSMDKLMTERQRVEGIIQNSENRFSQAVKRQAYLEPFIKNVESKISDAKKEKSMLASKYREISGEQFNKETCVCPTCGQVLQPEKIHEIEAEFSDKKKKRLAAINTQGMQLKAEIESNEKELGDASSEIVAIKNEKIALNKEKTDAMQELKEIPEYPDLSENQEYERICLEIAKLEEALKPMRNASSFKEQLKFQIDGWRHELVKVEKSIAMADDNSINERISELRAEQIESAQRISNSEKEMYLLEQFNRAKVEMLTDEINNHFNFVKWKLFEKQQNGRYKEICVPAVEGSDYGNGLNTGHMIAAEIDITSTLQRINKVSIPVFLDNAESVNTKNIPVVDCQLITLNVTENDEKLRVEVE